MIKVGKMAKSSFVKIGNYRIITLFRFFGTEKNVLCQFERNCGVVQQADRNMEASDRVGRFWPETVNDMVRLRAMVQALPDFACILDSTGRHVEILSSEENLSYHMPGQTVGCCLQDVYPADVAATILETLRRTLATNQLQITEYQLDVPAGRCWFEGRFTPISGSDGPMVLWLSRDITERRESEELATRRRDLAVTLSSERSLPVALGHILDFARQYEGVDVAGIYIRRRESSEYVLQAEDGFRTNFPDHVRRICGDASQPQVPLHHHPDYFGLADMSRLVPLRTLAEEGLRSAAILPVIHDDEIIGLLVVASRTCETLPADARKPLEAVAAQVGGFLARITAEEQLQQMRKLEAVGVLAGGIAHDYNNFLTAILGNLSLVRQRLESGAEIDPAELSELLSDAQQESLRAKDLTHQLLTLAKGGAPVRKPADLSSLLQTSVSTGVRNTSVRLECSVPADLWRSEVDSMQITQVFRNLTNNAAQAMPEGGCLFLTAENLDLHEPLGPLAPGSYVKISFRDEGHGIEPRHLSRIFDPYFSTRQLGSGLGLATSYAILRKHHGHISVDSRLGGGTRFDVYLPAVASAEVAAPCKTNSAAEYPGRPRILVMDDEESIRRLARRLLEANGYDVVLAAEGSEAVQCYRDSLQGDHPIQAVILDLTVPGGMGGMDAFRELQKINPEIRAIVSSGYSNDPIMGEYDKHGFCGVVAKPYPLEELLSTLHHVVGRPVA